MTNPTEAGLVFRPEHWPGAITLPTDFTRAPQTFKRPTWYFRDEDDGGKMPAKAVLTFHKPPHFEHLSTEEFADKLQAATKMRLIEIRKEIRAEGRRFAGVDKIRRTHWNDAPRRPAPRRTRHPHLSCADPRRRVAVLEARQQFLTDYRKALMSFRQRKAGKSRVVFPFGTFAMQTRHAVRCAPAPDG